MIKFLKKATSALLASVMCIPTGIVNITNAEINNPDGSYTVTLSDTENGLMQFSEESMNNSTASQDGYQMMQMDENGEMQQIENDGSLWAFSEGDTVEIECIPDNGYYVESLTLKDSETGSQLAKKDTVNNVFSFEMPAKNLSVEVVFSSTATINIKDDKDTKKSDGIEYHDIVEDMDISKEEVEEVVADVITESYIKSNLDEKYITVGDKIRMANALLVKNSIFDGAYIQDGDTIDSIMGSIESGDKDFEENVKKFISQLDAYVIVYDLNPDSNYYVSLANTMIRDSSYTVQDFAVAANNLDGENAHGCIYDERTGLLYIPKDLYESKEEQGKDIFMHLQIQFMQIYNKTSKNSTESMTSKVHMVSVDEKDEQIELASSEQKIFSMKTDVVVDKGMDPENLNVLVNGLPASEDSYTYNPGTGELSMEVSPSSVNSVEVTEGKESLSDELLDFMDKTEATETDLTNMTGTQLPESHPEKPTEQPPMELSDPVDLESMPSLRNVMYGTTSMEYWDEGTDAPEMAGSTVTVLYAGAGTNADTVNTNLMNYINGGAATNFAYIPEQWTPNSTYPFFASLGDFTRTTVDGTPLADEESQAINELIRQFGALGKMQMKCAHVSTPSIGDSNSGENRFTGKIAIRLLEEYHEENDNSTDGYLIFGLYTQHMTQTTQMGAGVFKVKYKFKKNTSFDPFYLYMFKKSTEGIPTIAGATLDDAEYEMLFYHDQHFVSAEDAVKKGSQTARFVFGTKRIDNGPGSSEYKRIANLSGIRARAGIDFFPKVDESGEFVLDESDPDNPKRQNDFLVEGHDEYGKWFGAEGTYVIREIKAPFGYELAGEMKGFNVDAKTSKPAEGLALDITITEENGEMVHSYKLNNKEITNRIINVAQEPGAALIARENPAYPKLISNAVCLDTNQQYVGSAHRTVSLKDTVKIDTIKNVDAKYTVTTQLWDLGTADDPSSTPLEVDWKHMSEYSETDKYGKTSFKTTFSTGENGHVNVGTTVTFDVGATVDISNLKGHTLVFINYLLIKQGADGSGDAIWGGGENGGLGKMSDKNDILEQIRIIDGISTSISSTQNNRKASAGESIIYAGMYKDNSYMEGNGEIKQALKDTITYTGLEKGKEYRIKAWLMDVTTNTPALAVDYNGTTIGFEGSKIAAAKDGAWDVTFQFDATNCGGRKYVSYVEVYDNDHLILEHKKPDDKKESFYIPKISTKLICEDTGTSTASNGETINFVDTISYKMLMPNARYKVDTKIIDVETGRELVDANGNAASVRDGDKIFTPTSENGEHAVHFSLAGVKTDSNRIVTNSLAGKTLVVYEYLYIEKNSNGSNQWVLIAEHADFNDNNQRVPIAPSGPLYLYMYKRSAGGENYGNADLSNARFEVLYYKGQKFNSAAEATRRGTLTATFTFKTASAKDASLGSVAYRNLANAGDINAFHGIDFFPKVDEAGNFICEVDSEGNKKFQNDFLVSNNKEEYTKLFGQPGTYVIREIEPPVGYSLSGEMSGYQSGQKTPKVSEGLALRIDDMVNSRGNVIHEYRINGERVNNPVVNAINMPDEETGAAIITDENPEYPELTSEAKCLETMQHYASSDSTTVSLQDAITVRTVSRVDAKYTVTTKLKDLTANRFIEARWENIGNFADNGQVGDRFTSNSFQSAFSTNRDGINAGDTVEFHVEGTVDGTALKGHTLVFINYLLVKEESDGSGRVIWGADANGAVKNGGLGEASSEDDRNEMVYFPEPTTDIVSAQNKRKGLYGEGIIYAGMYKDDTWTEGHGTRFQALTDTIYYKNCKPGREYTVKGWLMDAATGAPALDANNNEIKSMQTTWKQVASGTGNGSWEISYQFDATGCGGRKYVSYVEIFLGSELVASYKDINDSKESFLIPKITTKLRDNETGIDLSYADETISLTDTISYSKMMVGANYKIKTKVIDMETGKELVDVNGNAVKVPDTEKTAEAEDGAWDIPISFAASKKNSDGTIAKTLAGKTIVVYEYVYIEKGHNGSNQWVLIADHEDFEDKDQRVYIPYIDTLATDQKTEQHISNAEKNMVIYDAVNYNKINPKYKYWLESELRDKATGEVVFDDAGVKQVIKTPVTLDAESGIIEPEHGGAIFHLDAESFAGRTLVVYERLFVEHGNNSYLIADHEVLLDEEQTIHIPKVWTNAMIEDMFSNTVSDKVRVIDTFSYDNLIPGLTYKLKGRVIDRDQSIQAGTDVLADNTAKNEMAFTPDSSSGAVRLSFDIPKQNSGIFVVYEELYVIDAYDGSDHEILVAKHTDIGDLNQTVFTNPTIETSLKDALTQSKILDAKKDACLTDAISYKNFDPRIPYTIKGKLIDMETGNTLIDAQGNKVEVEQSVAADVSGTGEWDVDYKFDASKLAGTVIVAFEEVYAEAGEGKKLVSSHKEFWDDNQKVYIGDGNQIPPHYIHPLLLFSP